MAIRLKPVSFKVVTAPHRKNVVRQYVEELRLLGVRGSAFRLGYEFMNRSGLRRLKEPVCEIASREVASCTLVEWKQTCPPFIFSPESFGRYCAVIDSLLPEEKKKRIVKKADEALVGKIRCFSRWTADFGVPVNWHFNPARGIFWPSSVHWSKVLSHEGKCGDVKLTWEANRFPHLYTMVRAYVLTGDYRYVRGFTDQLISWEEGNPYRAGVNWNSCQELAIRAVSWIFSLYAFAKNELFTEEDFHRVQRLLILHGEHIARHIGYSRIAMQNNHLIGEALGLYLIGGCFPHYPDALSWKRTGRQLLEEECLRQFYPDGGYCQASHNYHRLSLHYYLWACRLAEKWGEPFSENVGRTLDRSAEYLATFLNPLDGRVPNWGANDGALLNPWTCCDYSDFRPVISSLRYLTTRKRSFPKGPWDEELLWFFGPEALDAPVRSYIPRSGSFPESGLHVHRGPGESFSVFRCGTVKDRFGQADQLHVDLWWKGINIALDGGSYLYNDEIAYHRHFMGTGSHNTVTVDGRDQMLLHRRFKWLYWTKANIVEWSPKEENVLSVEGEHFGYLRAGNGPVVHRRRLTALHSGGWKVEDRLIPGTPAVHEYRLHWLLGDYPYSVAQESLEAQWKIRQETPAGTIEVCIGVMGDSSGLYCRPLFSIAKGVVGDAPRGWVSHYYGERLPALSLAVVMRGTGSFRFETAFVPKE